MKQIVGIMLLLGLLSCQKNEPRIELIKEENLSEIQIDSILTEFKFKYESPIILDSSTQVIIPISIDLQEQRRSESKISGYKGNGYSYPRYWNVLFYNRETGQNRLLTADKIRISQIFADVDKAKKGKNILANKVLYKVANVDYNKDKKLNHNDPDFLFVSDNDGTNFKRLSPSNEDLQYFEVISNTKEILLKTRRDSNHDLQFNSDDEVILYKVKWGNDQWKLEEMIDATMRKEIGNLYFEQWLKKK